MTTSPAASGRRALSTAFVLLVVVGCTVAPSTAPLTASRAPSSIAPSVGPSTAPATAVPATAAPAAFEWQRLGRIPTTASIVGVAASPVGYVVLEAPRAVWFSSDGRAWQRTVLPFTSSSDHGFTVDAHANALTGGDLGFIVVGGRDIPPCTTAQAAGGPPPCDVGPISWVSQDGITWHPSAPDPLIPDDFTLARYRELVRVWQAGEGWDAAAESRDSVLYHGNDLLHSIKGRTWFSIAEGPLPEGATSGDDIYAHGAVETASGKVEVLWQTRDLVVPPETTIAVARSDVGGFTAVPGFEGVGASVTVGLASDATLDGSFLLLGTSVANGTPVARWWKSTDLLAWATGPMTTGRAYPQGIAALRTGTRGYVAVGYADVPEESSIPVTWLSPDGRTWTPLVLPAPGPADGPVWEVVGPAGLLGVGIDGLGASAWIGRAATP